MKNTRKGQKARQHRINDEIKIPKCRLTDTDGEVLGITNMDEALHKAKEKNLDLVEISPNADPPVCKIMDYGKFLYQKSKINKEQKKKQTRIQVKEVKFRPTTDEGDYKVKLRNLNKFLTEGNKTKVTLRFRGREMSHRTLGFKLLDRIKADLAESSVVESFPKMEGRQAIMVLAPKKK